MTVAAYGSPGKIFLVTECPDCGKDMIRAQILIFNYAAMRILPEIREWRAS
jgi:hypothetical protein